MARVLATAGITQGVHSMNSAVLLTFLSDRSKFVRSDLPRVGDIALWASHTGIVGGVGAGGTMKLIHAKGIKHDKINGKDVATPLLSGENPFAIAPSTYRTGSVFYGYYRPINEGDSGGQPMSLLPAKQGAAGIYKRPSTVLKPASRLKTGSLNPQDAPVMGEVEVLSEPGYRQPPPQIRMPSVDLPAPQLPAALPNL